MIALRHGELLQPNADSTLLHASATAENEAVAAWSSDHEPRRLTLTRQGASSITQSINTEYPADWAGVLVQSMPDGTALIATKRCEWVDGTLQRNARHISSDGETLREATLGDGIAHMLSDAHGNTWVGFFDEGIYGDVGWEGDGPGAVPIGAAGLLRFDEDLSLDWAYPGKAIGHYIDDCYALNVDGTHAVTCSYADFGIARVGGIDDTYWANEVAGATAVLVSANRCALVGGYGGDGKRLVIGHLGDGNFVVESEEQMDTRSGTNDRDKRWTVGRGPELHIFNNLQWSRWTLGDPA